MKHKQRETVYIITTIDNLDSTVDFEDQSPETFDRLEDALADAQATTREYGLRSYVYECIPIRQVDRGKIRVTKLKLQGGENNGN